MVWILRDLKGNLFETLMPWTGHLLGDQVALISSSTVVIDFARFIGVNWKCKFAELRVYEENFKLFLLKKPQFVNNH